MAEPINIFQSRIPSGAIAANSQVVLGEPVRAHTALTNALSAATVNLLDSADISAGARAAEQLHEHTAQLINSPNGAQGVRGVHPIINGIANLKPTPEQTAP